MRYRTIVADPPWDHSDGAGWNYGSSDPRWTAAFSQRKTVPPFPHLTVAEIAALAVSDLAERDAHLYLWTTNRYLRDAYSVAEEWGFAVVQPLIWCKAPMGFMGGAFTSSAEFCLFCRRGSLPTLTRAGRQWWEWKRPYGPTGKPAHSKKPEAFLDLVEQVSPGPYLEMFARRARFGWDYWGDESLSTVEMPA